MSGLIISLHGNCNEPAHYKRWYRLTAALARSGNVVAVPDLPKIREGIVHGTKMTMTTSL